MVSFDFPLMSNTIEISSARVARFGPRPSARAAAWSAAIAGLAIASLIVLASCRQERQERPLREVKLALSWLHQAQFCGPYYADRHGLYAAEGLHVTFVPADAHHDPLDEFLAGKYDFVIAQPDALIIARQKGHRVKAVAATFRIHPLVYMAKESSGIRTPHDFRGKTVGVAYSEKLPLVAMLRKLHIEPGELQIVPRSYGIEGLQKGEYDVEAGWATDELIHARKAGLAVNVIAPYDYGVTFYADVLAVRESLIEQEPELVEKVVRATMRGWTEALQDPINSARLPLHYDPKLDVARQLENLRASSPLVHTGVDRIGWMRTEDWDSMIKTLQQEGMIQEGLRAEDVHTTRFLVPAQ
jgi:NitT/TauT family transport system substrate-binding protein